MTPNPILDRLRNEGLLSDQDYEKIKIHAVIRPFSLHWELKSLLYLGVLLLNIGLGYLIYQNIDTIGHTILLIFIALICIACFAYAFVKSPPFTPRQTSSPTPYFDYVLLLGCLTFLIFEGYLQFQYNIFGTRYGLVTIIPTILFFFTAYYFDHRGALSLAIVGLASWVGIVVTPREMFTQNDFSNPIIIYTGVLLGIFLTALGVLSEKWAFKKHFSFTYMNFGVHIFFISALSGLIALDQILLFTLILMVGITFFIGFAKTSATFYFLAVAIIYAYIALTYLVFKYLFVNTVVFILPSLYFIITTPLVIGYLIKFKKNITI